MLITETGLGWFSVAQLLYHIGIRECVGSCGITGAEAESTGIMGFLVAKQGGLRLKLC